VLRADSIQVGDMRHPTPSHALTYSIALPL
jgi:hypothetical protein